jgi:NADPH:quinone reductase-like Zn-dependent oxidoreductase
MRAAQFDGYGEPDVLRVADVAIPEPAPGQVRIAVMAHAVNPIDWKVRSGKSPLVKQFPAGTGRDASGIVDAVGAGVDQALLGRAVMGLAPDTAAAQYTVLHHWGDKPECLSWDEAAAIPLAAETSMRVIRTADTHAGDTVLIDAASGSVGLAALNFARHLGLRVVGTCSAHNADLVRSCGATPIDFGDWSPEHLRELGVDHIDRVFDFSGRNLPQLIALVGDPARVVGIVDHVNGPLLGIHDSGSSPTVGAFDAIGLAGELAAAGHYTLRLGPVFGLDDTATAQQASFQGAQGKVIVQIGELADDVPTA